MDSGNFFSTNNKFSYASYNSNSFNNNNFNKKNYSSNMMQNASYYPSQQDSATLKHNCSVHSVKGEIVGYVLGGMSIFGLAMYKKFSDRKKDEERQAEIAKQQQK